MKNVQEAFEEYLEWSMASVCGEGPPSSAIESSLRCVEAAGLTVTLPELRAYLAVLGEPVRSTAVGDYERFHFVLSRWPGFEFTITNHATGVGINPEFVRAGSLPSPQMRNVSDLRKWCAVRDEIVAFLGQPTAAESWPPWEGATFTVDDSTTYEICFAYGLVQAIRVRVDKL